jgi:SpoVK/Ycf46/Vps4 family AAA+-type ATPase
VRWSDIAALIQAHCSGDDEHFRRIARQVCAKAPEGSRVTAAKLGEMLGRPRLLALPQNVQNLLYQVETVELSRLLLRDDVLAQVGESIRLLQHRFELKMQGLTSDSRLLFTGPPGCGKTSVAAAIGAALGLPCLGLSLAGAIESYMGATGKQLANALAAANLTPCVLLLDEVDAIAQTRTSDGASAQESARVVNTLCIELDRFNGIVVATTNRRDIIDPAILRRFDRVVDFGEIEFWQKVQLANRWVDSHTATAIADQHNNLASVAAAARRHAALKYIDSKK